MHYDDETTERLRQAIMRYRELLLLMQNVITDGERAYARLRSLLSDEERVTLKEKDQQWQMAEALLHPPAEVRPNPVTLDQFRRAVSELRFNARGFERDFEHLYDILSEL